MKEILKQFFQLNLCTFREIKGYATVQFTTALHTNNGALRTISISRNQPATTYILESKAASHFDLILDLRPAQRVVYVK